MSSVKSRYRGPTAGSLPRGAPALWICWHLSGVARVSVREHGALACCHVEYQLHITAKFPHRRHYPLLSLSPGFRTP